MPSALQPVQRVPATTMVDDPVSKRSRTFSPDNVTFKLVYEPLTQDTAGIGCAHAQLAPGDDARAAR
jgi:hypothetical protein